MPKLRLRSRSRLVGGRLSIRRPSKWISPWSGASSVASRCSSVLLPDPLCPTIAVNAPLTRREVDALQDGNRHLALAEALVQVARDQLLCCRLRRRCRRRLSPCIGRTSGRRPARGANFDRGR